MKLPALSLLTGIGLLTQPCAAAEDQPHQTQPNKRHVQLDGEPNFRDLGGYTSSDGKTLAWGKLYRTGSLKALSDDDVQKLDELGIKTVVNFLSELEVKKEAPDRVPKGTKQIHLPIDGAVGLGEEFMTNLMEARKTGDFSKIPASVNPDIHRALIVDGKKEYASLLKLLADPNNYPIAFHCSHGVHRTGTASAIVLSAMGVPWETIRKDYLLSNTYRAKQNTHRVKELTEIYAKSQNLSSSEVDASDIKAFYLLEGNYIDASLEQAIKDYGSMENYIRDGLGIDDMTLKKIKSNLLTN